MADPFFPAPTLIGLISGFATSTGLVVALKVSPWERLVLDGFSGLAPTVLVEVLVLMLGLPAASGVLGALLGLQLAKGRRRDCVAPPKRAALSVLIAGLGLVLLNARLVFRGVSEGRPAVLLLPIALAGGLWLCLGLLDWATARQRQEESEELRAREKPEDEPSPELKTSLRQRRREASSPAQARVPQRPVL